MNVPLSQGDKLKIAGPEKLERNLFTAGQVFMVLERRMIAESMRSRRKTAP